MKISIWALTGFLGLSLLRAQPPAPGGSPFENIPERVEAPLAALPPSGFTIEAIEFRGARRIPNHLLRALIVSRAGSPYDVAKLRRDAQALEDTRRFSAVIWETEPGRAGAIVRFVLAEKPLIQALDFQGNDNVVVAMPEILQRFAQRKIDLRPEAFLDEAELTRAAATVQELVQEKGHQDLSVIPLVEPVGPALVWPPAMVRIAFRVAPKQ